MSIINSMLDCVDSILGVRDSIGAVLKETFIVTRTWSGTTVGDGTAVDVKVQMLPTPYIVDLSHNLNIKEGGLIQQGDILIKNISKNSYPLQTDIDNRTGVNNVERFFMLGTILYKVITVKENYLTWDVQVRRLSVQRTYFA